MEWNAELPFPQSVQALRERGWSVSEIASFEECSQARVREVLGIDEPKPVHGDGLLPYLGLGPV